MLVTAIGDTRQGAEGPAGELLRRSSAAAGPGELTASRFVEFTLSDDAVIHLSGPEDLEMVAQLSGLLDRDRSLGAGSLDEMRLYILFRAPNGPRPGIALVSARTDLEALIRREFAPRVTRAEIQLILQTLAGQSLQVSAVRDRVSIETKKSQSKSLLSKLGFPDLGHLRAILLARLVMRLRDDTV